MSNDIDLHKALVGICTPLSDRVFSQQAIRLINDTLSRHSLIVSNETVTGWHSTSDFRGRQRSTLILYNKVF
jgi:hypothetical protein